MQEDTAQPENQPILTTEDYREEKMFTKRDIWLFVILLLVIIGGSLASIKIAQAL